MFVRNFRPVEFKTRYECQVRDTIAEAISGNFRAQMAIKSEAFTSSDFPLAFQKVNNAVMQQKLAEYTPTWPAVGKREVLDGLKPVKDMRLDIDTTNLPANNGGYSRIDGTLPRIPEGTEYPGFGFTQSEWEMGTAKNGGRISFTWEAFKEDDWRQIAGLPDEMLALAVNTEETEIWRQYYTTAGGFNANFFTSAQNLTTAGLYTGGAINPVLTLEALQAAKAKAITAPPTPVGSRPRMNTNNKWALIIPASLESTAKAILGITQVKLTTASGAEYLTTPDVGGITIVVVPWINMLTASGNYAQSTGWALVPYGGESIYGPTVIGATLRGRETPQLRIKNDQGQALGGGDLSPWEGDFDADSIQIRIQQWFKGNTVNNWGAVWSKGTGAGNSTP